MKIGVVDVAGTPRRMRYAEFTSGPARLGGLVAQLSKLRHTANARDLAADTEHELLKLALQRDVIAARIAWLEAGGDPSVSPDELADRLLPAHLDELADRLPPAYLERLLSAAQETTWPAALVLENRAREAMAPAIVAPFAIVISIGDDSRPAEIQRRFREALALVTEVRGDSARPAKRSPRLADRRSERAALFLWWGLRTERSGPGLRPTDIAKRWKQLTQAWARFRHSHAPHMNPEVEKHLVPAYEEWVKRSRPAEDLGAREVRRIIEARAHPRFKGA